MIKFFITGGAGFIGSNLAEKLLSLGHSVVSFDNFDSFYSEKIKRNNIRNAQTNSNYLLVEGDILDKDKLYKSLIATSPDFVIHLAAKGGVRSSIENPDIYYEVNVIGTLNLLECMRKANLKKMIFASSSSVYGNNKKIPFSENDNVDNPISPYAASKKAGELLCYTYHHLYDFDIFCLRFFTVYGPRQRPDLAINKFFKAILNREPIRVYGDGMTKRDYTYINDLIDGIISATKQLKGYEIINLGESNPIALNELIQIIGNITEIYPLIINSEVQKGDVNLTYADISKAKSLLNYKPNTKISKGLKLYYEWLQST